MGGVLDWIGLPAVGARVSDIVNPAKWLSDWASGPGRRAAAGVPVSPESAMALSAYFSGIRIVSEDLGKLPWGVEISSGEEDGLPTVRDARSHPIDHLLRVQPNREMGSQQFRELLISWALGWGNGRAEIERDGLGNPIALWPIHPTLIRPWRDPETWELSYYVRPFGGYEGGLIPLEDVFDVHGVGPDGITGYSLAQLARQDISTGLASSEFIGSLYAGGAVSRGVLKYPKKLDDDQLRRLRRQWAKTYGNGAGPEALAHPVILEGGMEFHSVSINPVDAQLLEQGRDGVVAIARWFRLPPHMLAALDRATFSNIEHLRLEYVQDTLLAWDLRLEGEANRKLLTPRELAAGYGTRLDLEGLLRGDHKTRTEALRTEISTGTLTPNEARAKQRRNPIKAKGADSLWLQGAMRTIDALAAEPAPAAAPPPPSDPSGQPAAEPADGEPADPAAPAEPGDGSPGPAKQPSSAVATALVAGTRDPAVANRQAVVDAAARAALAVGPVLLDAAARATRRQAKFLERASSSAATLRGAVAQWASGERGVWLELLVPPAAALVRTASAFACDAIVRAGARGAAVLSPDVPAVVAAVVDRWLAAQPEAAVARGASGRAFDSAAAGAELYAGILASLEQALVPLPNLST